MKQHDTCANDVITIRNLIDTRQYAEARALLADKIFTETFELSVSERVPGRLARLEQLRDELFALDGMGG